MLGCAPWHNMPSEALKAQSSRLKASVGSIWILRVGGCKLPHFFPLGANASQTSTKGAHMECRAAQRATQCTADSVEQRSAEFLVDTCSTAAATRGSQGRGGEPGPRPGPKEVGNPCATHKSHYCTATMPGSKAHTACNHPFCRNRRTCQPCGIHFPHFDKISNSKCKSKRQSHKPHLKWR